MFNNLYKIVYVIYIYIIYVLLLYIIIYNKYTINIEKIITINI